MYRLSGWARVPRNLTVAFLAVAAVSVVALIWLGARLVAQDRELEAERLREKRESAADRVVVALDQALSAHSERGPRRCVGEGLGGAVYRSADLWAARPPARPADGGRPW